jgi:hypothetical protein
MLTQEDNKTLIPSRLSHLTGEADIEVTIVQCEVVCVQCLGGMEEGAMSLSKRAKENPIKKVALKVTFMLGFK